MTAQSGASVALAGVSKRFAESVAADGVSLEVGRGELFALLGPSGCGKTTLLRLVAGLEAADAGTIAIAGADVTGVPPHRRPVHLVFQHYALFPHLDVAANVAFGLRYRGVARAAEPTRVAAALALVRLAGLERRYPRQLSGGQRQRVALARALVLRPEVLLLDEPLGALDQKLRQEMRVELKALQRTLGITFLLVTHDQHEALALADRIAVMHRGRIEQVGTPRQVYELPETAFVAEFMGAANVWRGEVAAAAGDELALRGPAGLELDGVPARGRGFRPGEAVRLVMRPERLGLRPAQPAPGPPPAGEAHLPVTVESRVYQGASTLWTVRDAAGGRFTVLAASPPAERAGFGAGLEAGAGGGFEPGSAALLCWQPRQGVVVRDGGDPFPPPPIAPPSSIASAGAGR